MYVTHHTISLTTRWSVATLISITASSTRTTRGTTIRARTSAQAIAVHHALLITMVVQDVAEVRAEAQIVDKSQ